jgi:uncharacterized protein
MIAPVDVRTTTFEPGVHRMWLAVGRGWLGPTPLPLVVVQGRTPGPRVVVIAAQHGDEGYAVVGTHRLAEEIDPDTLTGSVWLLPCLNVYGFTHGARVSPFDHHDMNRVHPGSEDGTVTEQISHALLEHILPGADLLIDLHGGSPENGDVAFARWSDVEGRESLEPLVRSLNVTFLLGAGSRDVPGMLSGATSAIDVPQIAIEACNAYGRTTDNAREMAGFVMAALRYLEMLPGPKPAPADLPVRTTATHRATTGGAWESFVTFGEQVDRGALLGVVRDLLGERVQSVTATASGSVAVMRTGTRVHPGETLCTLAVERDG